MNTNLKYGLLILLGLVLFYFLWKVVLVIAILGAIGYFGFALLRKKMGVILKNKKAWFNYEILVE